VTALRRSGRLTSISRRSRSARRAVARAGASRAAPSASESDRLDRCLPECCCAPNSVVAVRLIVCPTRAGAAGGEPAARRGLTYDRSAAQREAATQSLAFRASGQLTRNVYVAVGAGANWTFPACVASITPRPAPVNVTLGPEVSSTHTLRLDSVVLNLTGFPDLPPIAFTV